MGSEIKRLFAAWLAAFWLLGLAVPAAASEFAPGSTCHAFADREAGFATLASQPELWDCVAKGWRVEGERAFIRFDLRGAPDKELPRWFVTRASHTEGLTLTVIRKDGSTRSTFLSDSAMRMADGFAQIYAPLPPFSRDDVALMVTIEQPRFAGQITEARLTSVEPVGTAGPIDIFIAILCGLLIAPILFDLAFYRVLRERFLFWHALTGTMLLVHTALTGGILNRFVPVPFGVFSTLSGWSFALAICSAALFFGDFIEPDRLLPKHRRALRGAGLASLVIALFDQLSLLPAAIMQQVFYAAWAPVVFVFVWLIGAALRRGSRAAKFQMVAWSPLIATGFCRIFGNLGMYDVSVEAFMPFYVSITLEAIITALGVADRFMIIKRERDRARIELRILGELAELDPLTGLYNRRGIEERFAGLFAEGFNTMAVIDLDHFKSINDTHGHAVGDQVLKATAEALRPDTDTLALRLGGEEFMLLLRGTDTAQRAEARRQAITLRVATLVPGLDRPLTASMGLMEIAMRGKVGLDFAQLYALCDRLLYEAKAAGRNRTLSERMRSFASTEGTGIRKIVRRAQSG